MKPDLFWFFWNLVLLILWVVNITLRVEHLGEGNKRNNQVSWPAFCIFFFFVSLCGVIFNSGVFSG